MSHTLDFVTYDVFTDTRFAGNPLAIVFGADALSDAQMQTITREFNLSETVFVCAAADAGHTASVRIFTMAQELPFAGHPTIGCAIALAEARQARAAPTNMPPIDIMVVLEEKVGPVRCGVKLPAEGASFAEFSIPKLSQAAGADLDPAPVARAFGLRPEDIGFGAHAPSLFSAGVPFAMIPLAGRDALKRAAPQSRTPALDVHGVYLYTRADAGAAHSFQARMFSQSAGLAEDPATGAAAAAFSGVLARFENLPDGRHTFSIQQGVEMGRPSLIGLDIEIANGVVDAARIAGKAVKISEGKIWVR